ncbi:MAG: DUF1080 domain-containing protein [Sedimentisphaerales bacterium]|nr:DUF1080 domain-containing protein [Sedimentisphaerales bacterium]
MNFRKITSLTAFLSFIILLITSIVLYIVPHGRVAYWSDWHLWGLSKTEWGNLHINIGVLFLLAIFLHMYYNWKPIANYLKNKSKRLVIFTREFNVALILLLVFSLGTYFEIPPLSWVLDAGESIKEAGIERYGEPPYGHAELSSLKLFAKRTELDLAESLARLQKAGVKYENESQSILEVAEANGMTPKELYEVMKPEQVGSGETVSLPEIPKPGLGKRTLKSLCDEYNLDIAEVIQALEKQDIHAGAEMDIKTIAEQNQTSPMEVYAVIWSNVNNSQNEAEKVIHLFNGKDLSGFYTFLKDSGRDSDPKEVFTVKDSMIRISGEEWGGLVTQQDYENYHLIAEFKWGGKTFAPRLENARDSGLVIHSQGDDGAYGGWWMFGIEVQMIEGGTGDFIVVSDGRKDFLMTSAVDKNGHVYQESGTARTFYGGRIDWWGRDPDWKDVIGFRGKQDVEKPLGQWNRLECIAQGQTITVLLNGVVVNRCLDVQPRKGKIQIQSEGAEVFFRRFDLIPLAEEKKVE